MRDLTKYPITDTEIVECLTRLADQIAAKNRADESAGDMTPLLLRAAAEIVRKQPVKG